jgi:DNA-directed RNA polymerase subunit RPC12/RpoP
MADEMRAFGYICPKCGKSVYGERSLFAISAAPMEIECECGKSALRTEFDGMRYHAEVPCGLCGGTHSAAVSEQAMLHGRGIGLSCTKTGQICCYIGEPDAVSAKLRDLGEIYEKMRSRGEDGGAFLDSVIMYEVLSEIKDIAARGGISCECGSRSWGMKVRSASVELFCRDCGARLMIPASTDANLDDLCCQMELKIKRA